MLPHYAMNTQYIKLNPNAITFFSQINMGPQVKGSLIGDVTNPADLTPLPGTDIKDILEFLKPKSPYYGVVSQRCIRNMIDLCMYHTTGDCYYIIRPTPLMQQLLGFPSTQIDLNDV